jgi:AsmA protein
MNKAVRLSMIGAGVCVAVVILALGLFISTFDINNYKGFVSRLVKIQTGRELTFGGEIGLTVFPRLGVRMNDVSLSNAPGFADEPMLVAREARLEVRILPLLSGSVRFGHLDLSGVSLALERDAEGETNWNDLIKSATKDSREGKKTHATAKDDEAFVLEIAGVSLADSTLTWNDRMSGTSLTLTDCNLTTGAIGGLEPFPVKAGCAFRGTTPALDGQLEAIANVNLKLDSGQISLTDLDLTASAKGADVPGGSVAAEAKAGAVSLDLHKENLKVDAMTVTAYGATARVDGALAGFDAARRITATVTLDQLNGREVLAALGLDQPETADASALTRVGGTAQIVVDGDGFEIKDMHATVDETSVSGSLSHRQAESAPTGVIRIQIGTLDLDRYLPPETAARNSGAQGATGAAVSPQILDTDTLRSLSLDLEAVADSLRVRGIRLEQVTAALKAQHGVVRITPVTAALYGGKLSAGATINAQSAQPRTDCIIGLDRVDVAGLSRDTLGSEEYKGLLSFNGAVTCQGERLDAMLASMNGKTGMTLADGVFPGVDLLGMAKTTHASRGRKDGTVESDKSDTTRFGSITGTGTIADGVIRNRDLEIKAPGLRADGQGAVALTTGVIDYLIKVKLVASSEGQGGKASGDLYGVMVPIRVKGTLANPTYRVSISEYVKALGGAVIDTAGSVIDTAGSVIGGVAGVIKGVGKAIVGGDSDNSSDSGEKKKSRFLGIF